MYQQQLLRAEQPAKSDQQLAVSKIRSSCENTTYQQQLLAAEQPAYASTPSYTFHNCNVTINNTIPPTPQPCIQTLSTVTSTQFEDSHAALTSTKFEDYHKILIVILVYHTNIHCLC